MRFQYIFELCYGAHFWEEFSSVCFCVARSDDRAGLREFGFCFFAGCPIGEFL